MYFKCLKDGDCTYSIDRFTFDFYFLPESGLYDLLKTSLDLLALEYRQQMNVQDFVTKRLGFEKLVYQFDHLHIELWKRENTVTITRYIPEDDKYLKAYVAGEKQCVLRLDFNPNKCEDNKPLERLMHFFATTEMYFDLYKLPMEYRRDYEKQFAPENLGLTFCEEFAI